MLFQRLEFRCCIRLAGLFGVLAVSPAAGAAAYTQATSAGTHPDPNTFEAFNPSNIPGRVDEPRPAFHATFAYSGRDWTVYAEPRKPSRRPVDPTRYQRTVLSHRAVPAALAISFEQVETTADADPVTLAKILRFNREANVRFRVLKETTRSLAGVEGTQAECPAAQQKAHARAPLDYPLQRSRLPVGVACAL